MLFSPPLRRPLTGMQQEIADRIGRGEGYALIAQGVHISERTVRHHVVAIDRKLPFVNATTPYRRIMIWVNARARATGN